MSDRIYLDEFGHHAVWTHNGAKKSVRVIPRIKYGVEDQAGSLDVIETRLYTAKAPKDTIPGVRDGDSLTLDGRDYAIVAVQPNFNGWITLILDPK